ncbi:MAG: vWA domain-containing protein [Phycisphaerales bacterium]
MADAAEHPAIEARARRRGAWQSGVKWLLLGLALSLPIHASFLVWMALTRVSRHESQRVGAVAIETAILPEDGTGEPSGDVAAGQTEVPDGPEAKSETVTPPAETVSIDPLAGGEATGPGLGGGAGGTSFFGGGGRGNRFAYVVDKSGSMTGRIVEAKEQLLASIAALPDYASVYVVFYDSAEPLVFSDRWERVRSGTMQRLRAWLRTVGPSGGTEPVPAFRRVFALDVRPDVVFFLSDGEIPRESVEDIRGMNARGRRVTINAIAFGDEAGSAQLRQVAQEAGGEFRQVRPTADGGRR